MSVQMGLVSFQYIGSVMALRETLGICIREDAAEMIQEQIQILEQTKKEMEEWGKYDCDTGFSVKKKSSKG